jgi:hypothetical protein
VIVPLRISDQNFASISSLSHVYCINKYYKDNFELHNESVCDSYLLHEPYFSMIHVKATCALFGISKSMMLDFYEHPKISVFFLLRFLAIPQAIFGYRGGLIGNTSDIMGKHYITHRQTLGLCFYVTRYTTFVLTYIPWVLFQLIIRDS